MQLQRLQQLVMPSRCRANISLQRGLSGENFVVQPSCAFLGRGVFRVRSDIIHPGGGPFQIGTKHGHSPWNGGSRRGKAARGSAFTRAVARLGFSRGSAFRRAWPFAGLGLSRGLASGPGRIATRRASANSGVHMQLGRTGMMQPSEVAGDAGRPRIILRTGRIPRRSRRATRTGSATVSDSLRRPGSVRERAAVAPSAC